ncbi:hypothetical protein NHP190003_05760 [Helicobacter sp. NHP19-003]|uniref:Uncharacterized protein n=1 Tax=Helicobacter gastrocanis TaxID=2849641 RepID=A0ABN6I3R3_9HELI|nr:hypothetical protein [Helicobacter sp. NHP19-003]BCZ17294.1 hypothetical protein NHP190003_05760 [Helicobacter sp. NHP19-003]
MRALALSLLLSPLLALPTGEQLLREEQVQQPRATLSAVFFSQKQPYTSWTRDYGVWQTKHILEIKALSKRVHINKITLNRGRCALLPILPSFVLHLGEKMDYEVFCEGHLRVEIDTDFGAQIFHLREDFPNDPF